MSLNKLLDKLLYIEFIIASGALAYAAGDELQTKYRFDDTVKYVLIVISSFYWFSRLSGRLSTL